MNVLLTRAGQGLLIDIIPCAFYLFFNIKNEIHSSGMNLYQRIQFNQSICPRVFTQQS